MRKNESVDRRWKGVRIPSMYRVCRLAARGDETPEQLAPEAWQALKAGRVWREYEAVFSDHQDPQILGFRKVRMGDWFILGDDGDIAGPFPTRRLCLRKLRVTRCSRTDACAPGIYLVPGYTLFTRQYAPDVGLNRQELS